MGRKKPNRKKKRTRLEKSLRKLARVPVEPGPVPEDPHIELAEAAEAVVPAEVQLGGGDVLGSLAQVPASAATSSGETVESAAQSPRVAPGRSATAGGFTLVEGRPSFDLFTALQERRTHKRFLARPVSRRALEVLLEAAVLAPNHKMTEPWSFVVLGESARRRYGEIRANAKLGANEDRKPDKRAKIVDEIARIPAIIAVKMRVDDNDVRREEDYAATFMAVQNLLLAATGVGLATKVNTGSILDDDELRRLVGAKRNERVVALLNAGYPAEYRDAKRRTPAADLTTWLP